MFEDDTFGQYTMNEFFDVCEQVMDESFPYRVSITGRSGIDPIWDEIDKWLANRGWFCYEVNAFTMMDLKDPYKLRKYHVINTSNSYLENGFLFKDEDSAMLFKLTWGGE